MLLTNKKELTIVMCNNVEESLMHNAKHKKSDSKGYILCESIYRTFLKRQNYRDRKKHQWLSGPRGKMGKRKAAGQRNLAHDGTILDLDNNCCGCTILCACQNSRNFIPKRVHVNYN